MAFPPDFLHLKVTIKCILCNYQPRVYSFVVSALFSRRPTGKNASCSKKVGEYIHTREASGGGGQTSGVSGPWWTSVKGLKWHASQKKQEIYFILKNFNYLKFEQCPKVVKCKEHLTIYGNRCTNWKLFGRTTALNIVAESSSIDLCRLRGFLAGALDSSCTVIPQNLYL